MIDLRSKLYEYEPGVQTRWATFENPKAEKGKGGISNNAGKGRAFEPFAAGETKVLLDTAGSGVVTRIWMTICNRSPEALHGVKIRMFWDNAATPAVDVPLGDFFCAPFGKLTAFENELFASPEGKSFNCFIPMPFREAARIELANLSGMDIAHLFYEVDFELRQHKSDIMYFHCAWNSADNLPLGQDYELLPKTSGAGKIIGVNMGVDANKLYGPLWWGEGEVKVYLDGDEKYPTLCGTGAEDYIGTGWGLGSYANRSQGSMVVDDNGIYTFYRLHTNDPIHFESEIRMTIQAIGGGFRDELLKVDKEKAPYKIVTRDNDGILTLLADTGFELDESSPDGWYNFYRLDKFRSTVYYYRAK